MTFKNWLRLTVGAATLVAGSSQAQVADGDTAVLEEVVVTGARLQNRRAVEAKRDAENIVDSLTADEVGALPDFSLAEALRRVSGVSTEDRNGDAEYVVVRGLRADFNAVTIDGAMLPSTRFAGRATQLSVIPSYIVRQANVVKSFSADLDANVLGGQFDLQTRSAYDQDGPYLTARAAVGAYDHDETPDGNDPGLRADFALATRFGDQDQFGVVLGGSYFSGDYGTWLPGVAFSEYDFIEPDGARRTTLETASADAVFVPHGAQMYQYRNELERLSGYGKLEYRPNDRLYVALSAYQFDEIDTEQRWDTLLIRNRAKAPRELTRSTGLISEGSIYNQYFLQDFDVRLRGLTLSGRYAIDQDQSVEALVSVSDGRQENPFYQTRFDTGVSTRNAYRYDDAGSYPVLTLLDPQAWLDTTRYRAIFYRPRLNIAEQDARQAKFDYAYNADPADLGWGLRLGAAHRTDERFNDQVFDFDYRPNTPETRAFNLSQALLPVRNEFEPNLIAGLPQLYTDEEAFLDYFAATAGQWRDAKIPEDEAISSDYRVREEIAAAYVMGQYASDRLSLRAGLRYERTDVVSTGFQRLNDTDPSTDKFIEVREEDTYGELLPSVSFAYELAPDLRLRGAYSRTLGRADYDDLSVVGGRVVDDAMRTISVTSGNPELAPRVSDNFDLSLERYLPGLDGIISLGVFHKTIENEVFTRTTQSETTIGGMVYQVSERRPQNANDAELSGIEVGLTIGSFDFVGPMLADVGLTANYAHIDSRFTIEISSGLERELYGLLTQPKDVGNLAIFYRGGKLDLRAALNYRGRYLQSASASSPTFDEFFGIERRVDVQAKYDLGRGLTAFVEARNITDDASDQLLSYGRVHWTRDYGRSAWLGFTYAY